MFNFVASLLIFSLSQVPPSLSYGTGAPSVACYSLSPAHHGATSQTTPNPYKVILDKTALRVNEPLNITLTSLDGKDTFQGFLVQVRPAVDNEAEQKPSGEFQVDSATNSEHLARGLACDNTANLAMTHLESTDKQRVSVRWMATKPGKYRVHVTFLKDFSTFWANQVHPQIIEVKDNPAQQHPPQPALNINSLCSTLKLNASLEFEPAEYGNYFQLKVASKQEGHEQNPQTVYKGDLMWLNITSELGSPISRAFLQVRPQKPSKEAVSAVGTFLPQYYTDEPKARTNATLINCFGGRENAILFENFEFQRKKVSELSFLWKAPDTVGDYLVSGSLANEEAMWDRIGEDPESWKIKVVRNPSQDAGQTHGGNKPPGKQTSVSGCPQMGVTFLLSFMSILIIIMYMIIA